MVGFAEQDDVSCSVLSVQPHGGNALRYVPENFVPKSTPHVVARVATDSDDRSPRPLPEEKLSTMAVSLISFALPPIRQSALIQRHS
ncbi:hypothetical protein CMQ_6819 [Grosmannia clavigera kw1407]|uniref:Uncharacterized protein n=1 Tax=Grosmannia clavigera (strain kw1407 / UAMH 11150) TaxID=655863 RepID=F0X7C6_GROCL|nr:uncharacterized protein CMQ_6819 [Grosmannia clavigera kw1407]EFX06498.1 hypothetical protein CMQ_6819 [Grosmannia clavigera kw1407]